MNADDLKPGLRVRVKSLGSTRGLLADPQSLDRRREGDVGHLTAALRADADFWWVKHLDGKFAPYSYSELEAFPDEWSGSPLG